LIDQKRIESDGILKTFMWFAEWNLHTHGMSIE
jgi:hypothetical protein